MTRLYGIYNCKNRYCNVIDIDYRYFELSGYQILPYVDGKRIVIKLACYQFTSNLVINTKFIHVT